MTKRLVLMAVVVSVVLVSSLFAAGGVSPRPNVPDELLAIVEIANPGQFETQMNAFLTAGGLAGPGPLSLKVDMEDYAGGAQLDRERPVRALVLRSGQNELAVVTVLSVADADALMQDLATKMEKRGVEDGVTTFVEEKTEIDKEAMRKAMEGGAPDMEGMMKTIEVPMAVGLEGATACMGASKDAVAQALKLVRGGKLTDKPIVAARHHVAAYVRVKAMMEHMATGKESALGDLAKELGGLSGMAGPVAADLNEQSLAGMEELAVQIDGVYMSVRPSAEKILCISRLYAAEGTLGDYLESVPEGLPEMLGHMPADGLMFAASKVGDLAPFLPALMDAAKTSAIATGVDAKLTEDLMRISQELMELCGEDFAASIVSGAGQDFSAAMKLRDAAAGEKVGPLLTELVQIEVQMARAMGAPLNCVAKPSVATHAGAQIDEIALTFDASAAEPSDDPARAKQVAAMQKAFGEGLKVHSAVAKDNWLMAMGREGSLERLKAMLDGSQQKLTDAPYYKEITKSLPTNFQGLFYGRLSSALAAACKQAIASLPEEMRAQMTLPEVQPGPGLYGAMRVGGRDAAWVLVVPADEVSASAAAGMGLFSVKMAVAMQQMMEGMKEGGEGIEGLMVEPEEEDE